jgi:uncharacterized damage-inducible protein DinB
MKEILLQYANYNIWANNRLIEAFMKLEEALLDREVISSFPSLRKTVYHTWAAEYLWLQRLEHVPQPVWLSNDYAVSFREGCREWAVVSDGLARLVGGLDDGLPFKQTVQYSDSKKQVHATQICDMLQHVFNHSTYHRGQMVTILRELGVTEIPGTDLIGFVRLSEV